MEILILIGIGIMVFGPIALFVGICKAIRSTLTKERKKKKGGNRSSAFGGTCSFGKDLG